MTTIKIFKSINEPLPRLSNNFTQEMDISGIKYKSVTNYIYSKMLRTPMFSSSMAKAKEKGKCTGSEKCRKIIGIAGKCSINRPVTLKKLCTDSGCKFTNLSLTVQYNEFRELEINNFIKETLLTALSAKFSDENELTELLLETENRPIIYINENIFLGADKSFKGGNIYGKTLEELRNRLKGSKSQILMLYKPNILDIF